MVIEKYSSPIGDGNDITFAFIVQILYATIEKYSSPIGDGNFSQVSVS